MRPRTRVVVAAATALVVGAAVTSLAAAGAAAASAPVQGQARTYLVVLRQAPTASYVGGLPGLARTAPAPGTRYDDSRPAVAAYRSYLLAGQRALLAGIGNPTPLYLYTTALDGFAVRLTPGQASTLEASSQVLEVQPDAKVHLDSASIHSRFGAAASQPGAPTGLWDLVGGAAHAGRGIVIGVVDSGVWPDNPSLAGIPATAAAVASRYPGFTGTCQSGDRWNARTCDSKVIAADFFVSGFGADNVASSDFLSPRDGSGHGTGVAAIAAGSSGVDTSIGDQSFGHISGIAPAAAVADYKACWTAPDPSGDGCDTADTLAAIDRAVADGVDVLDYSIGGTSTSLSSPVELAFLNAAAANVFVATSAGNGGPGPSTVQHPSPWVTTVGANTHAVYQGGVRLGNGSSYIGAMLSDRSVGPVRLVAAGDAAAAGVPRAQAALCSPSSLDAAVVEGTIVVCERGVTSRVSKSAAVAQAGGRGMVLVNTQAEELDADLQSVPTVHLDSSDGAKVLAYIRAAGAGATATIDAGATSHPAVPEIAPFSARGPSAAVGGDLLKPDLTAPGVTVVSAAAPPSDGGRLWDVVSGTSMSAATVAGLAAVLEAAHPTWTPDLVHSALVTSATPLRGDDSPLVRGAGEADPTAALQPGLAFASGASQWAALLRGQGVRLDGLDHGTTELAPSALNQPSIAVGDLVGQTVVSRTVTNVGDRPATYAARLSGLPGIAASVAPASLTLRPGAPATFQVTLSANRTARYDSFSTGTLSWTRTGGTGPTVTEPVVVRPELATVPGELHASGTSGSITITGHSGVTGTISTHTSGLVGATPVRLELHPAPFDPTHPETSPGTATQTLTVPGGSPAARFEVRTANAADAVGVYVYRGTTRVAQQTGLGGATVTLAHPPAGVYRIYVTSPHSALGALTRASFSTWVVPPTGANLTVTPTRLGVDGGEPFAISASWHGLDRAQRWFGVITYRGLPSVTYVTLN